jgi:alpha-tubulin suppressor-like RCC1 family protein
MRESVMYGKEPKCRRAARAIAGASMLAAALLATAGAAPAAAVPRASHSSLLRAAGRLGPPGYGPLAAAAGGASQWKHITAGGEHTCGIQLGNTLWCWGYNHYGELGLGTATFSESRPQEITRPTARWASVSAGGMHTCATRSDTTLWCWGANFEGDLGIGSTGDQDRPRQVTTPAATGWASVSSGGFHTCATRTDATLWCWGANTVGELGIGSTSDQDRPQQVTTPAATGWATAAAGDSHTCATRSDGTLWCWGYNGTGQLGLGSTAHQDHPQQVTTPTATGWAAVTAGTEHTCATRGDTTVWCWGRSDAGQLGSGTKTDQDLPQQVTTPAATGWTTVTAGGETTCATRIHKLWCWGFNRYGQLGIGSTTNQARPRRVPLPTGTGWSLMAVGALHTCATRTGHTLWCWGYNYEGQLGIGNRTGQDLPQQVTS